MEALQSNPLAEASDIIIFSDAPKQAGAAASVQAVRNYIRTVSGFKSVTIVEQEKNLGLATSIINGVSRVCETHGSVIVIEDDLITSRFFLSFMNDALDRYADTPQVAAISGFHPPFDTCLPETFFQRDAECWGWATWRRAWRNFNPDGHALLAELRTRNLLHQFDQDGSTHYVRMLEDQIAGRNDSWAIRWRASVFLAGMLSVYPGRSLTRNIGFDGSGTHCELSHVWETEVSATPVTVGDIPVVHSEAAYQAFVRFNRSQIPSLGQRVSRKLKKLFKSR